MKKYTSKYETNNNVDNNYLEELRQNPNLKGYEITEENYIDFDNLLRSINNCKKCSGLENCLNNSEGHQNTVILTNGKYYFGSKPCKYKEELKKEALSNEYLNTLYISKKVLESKLDDYRLTNDARIKAHNYVKKFINEYSPNNYMMGLCLCGPCGCGKTYLLSSLANELAKKHIGSLLIYVPDLIRDLKSAIGTPRLEEVMNMLKTVPVLILDDLGSEMMTPWVRDEILSPLFNFRMMDEKPVFVSTNLGLQSLQKHFAQTNVDEDNVKATRIMSRFKNLVHIIKFDEI